MIENGVLLPTPFLDISALVDAQQGGALATMAFHPDYAENGRFFVRYSAPRAGDPAESCNDPDGFVVGCHIEVLSEFGVSDDDPNVADPTSERILFQVDEPAVERELKALLFCAGLVEDTSALGWIVINKYD